jgi:hypothetical protein
MAQDLKASVSFIGDGNTTKFYFGFDYINKQFIKVSVGTDGTLLSYPTDYTVNDKEVEFVKAPANGTPIRIYRQTNTSRIIEWSDGAFIKALQMTLENVQQLHLIEESQDYVIINGMSKYPDGVNFNALGARVINVADPKESQDAVTKHYMETVQGGFVSQNTALVEQATTQATNAKNSASSAATSASQSASSASASETSNQSAKKWAESTDSPDNQADTDSTTGKTQSSRSWALYSKAKAQEAITATSTMDEKVAVAIEQASNAAKNAENSRVNAENSSVSAEKALSAANNAGAYANAAQISEVNAAESAKQAAESAVVSNAFTGATATQDGTAGIVPKPRAGLQNSFLAGSGTWEPVYTLVPTGMIVLFKGTLDSNGFPIIPSLNTPTFAWHVCDGTNGTPDLRDKFIPGTSYIMMIG